MDRLDALTLRQLQSFVAATGITSESPTPDDDPDVDDGDAGGGAAPVLWPRVVVGAGLRPHRPPGSRPPAKLPATCGFGDAGDGPEKQVMRLGGRDGLSRFKGQKNHFHGSS